MDHLGKDDLMILATCQIEGDVTNQRLQYLVDRHKTEITKFLQDLCKRQLLISDNKGRWTTYHLNKDYKVNLDSSNLDSSSKGHSSISKKLPFDTIVSIIKDFCSDEYRSIEEISERVERNAKYLKNEIIPKIIKSGELIREHSENHPNQRFKSVN